MPRPRAKVDLAKVLDLHARGLPSRAIAKAMKVSKSLVCQIINGQRTPDVNTDVSINHVHKTPKSNVVPQPTEIAQPALASHHVAYSVQYRGQQPISIDRVAPNPNNVFYQFDYTGARKIVAYKNRLTVWLEGESANTSQDIARLNEAKAKRILAGFAWEKRLTLDSGSLEQVCAEHLTVEDEQLNAFLQEQPDLKDFGLKPETSSHEGKVQADTDKGRSALAGLMALPEQMARLERGFLEYDKRLDLYDKNIEKHMAVLESMDKTLKAIEERIRKGIK